MSAPVDPRAAGAAALRTVRVRHALAHLPLGQRAAAARAIAAAVAARVRDGEGS